MWCHSYPFSGRPRSLYPQGPGSVGPPVLLPAGVDGGVENPLEFRKVQGIALFTLPCYSQSPGYTCADGHHTCLNISGRFSFRFQLGRAEIFQKTNGKAPPPPKKKSTLTIVTTGRSSLTLNHKQYSQLPRLRACCISSLSKCLLFQPCSLVLLPFGFENFPITPHILELSHFICRGGS